MRCKSNLFLLMFAVGMACEATSSSDFEPNSEPNIEANIEPNIEYNVDDEFRSHRQPEDRILPGPDFYPEGIAVSRKGTFYVGSLGTGAIVRIPRGSEEAEPFVAPREDFRVFGLVVDSRRRTLWACTYDSTLAPEQAAYINGYDLRTGELRDSYPLPGTDSFCNDLVLGNRGDLYATDSSAGTIVKLARGADEVQTFATSPLFIGEPGAITLNGIVFDRHRSRLLVVRYDTGNLFSVSVGRDGNPGLVEEIQVEPSLEFPDGIELRGRDTLVVVENLEEGRVSQIDLNGNCGEKQVIESGLREPTTAALYRGYAWVAEGQLSHLFQGGEPTLPFRVVPVKVPR